MHQIIGKCLNHAAWRLRRFRERHDVIGQLFGRCEPWLGKRTDICSQPVERGILMWVLQASLREQDSAADQAASDELYHLRPPGVSAGHVRPDTYS
jgi:hypothetical protein